MVIKRSPRYPRVSLSKAVGLVSRLYDGAHQAKVDAETAAQVMGYTTSSSGAAAGALGSLRQYGLVDGLRGDLCVSDLAMRILQPMRDEERLEALYEAAKRPEVFAQVLRQFDGELPKSDAPILAFLVRGLGFSQSGGSELISVLRETFSELPAISYPSISDQPAQESIPALEVEPRATPDMLPIVQQQNQTAQGDFISLPLGPRCKAELRFFGEVSAVSYERLVRHLELLRETLDAE